MRRMFGPSTPSGAASVETSAETSVEAPKEKSIIAEAVAEISSVEGAAEIELDQELIKTELISAVRDIKTSYGSVSVGSSNFALRSALDNLEIQLS